jgi:hypothetical protein
LNGFPKNCLGQSHFICNEDKWLNWLSFPRIVAWLKWWVCRIWQTISIYNIVAIWNKYHFWKYTSIRVAVCFTLEPFPWSDNTLHKVLWHDVLQFITLWILRSEMFVSKISWVWFTKKKTPWSESIALQQQIFRFLENQIFVLADTMYCKFFISWNQIFIAWQKTVLIL